MKLFDISLSENSQNVIGVVLTFTSWLVLYLLSGYGDIHNPASLPFHFLCGGTAIVYLVLFTYKKVRISNHKLDTMLERKLWLGVTIGGGVTFGMTDPLWYTQVEFLTFQGAWFLKILVDLLDNVKSKQVKEYDIEVDIAAKRKRTQWSSIPVKVKKKDGVSLHSVTSPRTSYKGDLLSEEEFHNYRYKQNPEYSDLGIENTKDNCTYIGGHHSGNTDFNSTCKTHFDIDTNSSNNTSSGESNE